MNCALGTLCIGHCKRAAIRAAMADMLSAAMTDTSITRTLGLALLTVGNLRRLAEHLGVSEVELVDWLTGERKPPTAIYMRALDLVARGPFIAGQEER